MNQDLESLCRDIGTILENKESVTLFELSTLTEERQPRIKAVLDLIMLKNDSIELKGTTYTYHPKQEPLVLYAVFAAEPIYDSFYFNPEEPSPTVAEIAEQKFIAAFRDEKTATEYASDYGFQVLRIEESIPEDNDEKFILLSDKMQEVEHEQNI